MLAYLFEIDEYARFLSGAFEVEQRASARKRIGDLESRAIPALAAVIDLVGINRIARVEAVRHVDLLPKHLIARLRTLPHFPGTSERAAIVFPVLKQSLRRGI